MKVMSEGIQKVAGSKIRKVLSAMTSNRFTGVLTGFLITSLIQSSSATTVMVVSFVNAGLLNLTESIGVIMGANIGTTITAWIISLIGFKVKIVHYALPILAIGVPMLFVSKSKPKAWGEFLIGFALLFMGLAELKASVPDLKSNPEMLAFIQHYANPGYLSILLFVGIGTVITLVVQSSSAAMAITLVMANQGWIPFELAASMVLGENIGTTITANIAALIANVQAKRAALAHFIFNITGVIWMLVIFIPFLKGIEWYMITTGNHSPFIEAASIPIGLSIFHTMFNIVNTSLMIGFVPKIAEAVTKLLPSKGLEDEFHLEYIGMNIMRTPEISILEARKEIAKFAKITAKMSQYTQELITKKQHKSRRKLMEKIRRYEEITDRIEVEVAIFLSKVAEGNLSEETSFKIRDLLSINNDLERVGDLFYQMSLAIKLKHESDTWFSQEQIEKLMSIFHVLDEAIAIMNDNLKNKYSNVDIQDALEKEKQLNSKRNELREEHLRNVASAHYSIRDALVYSDLIQSCEKIGDHIINVTEAVVGQV